MRATPGRGASWTKLHAPEQAGARCKLLPQTLSRTGQARALRLAERAVAEALPRHGPHKRRRRRHRRAAQAPARAQAPTTASVWCARRAAASGDVLTRAKRGQRRRAWRGGGGRMGGRRHRTPLQAHREACSTVRQGRPHAWRGRTWQQCLVFYRTSCMRQLAAQPGTSDGYYCTAAAAYSRRQPACMHCNGDCKPLGTRGTKCRRACGAPVLEKLMSRLPPLPPSCPICTPLGDTATPNTSSPARAH